MQSRATNTRRYPRRQPDVCLFSTWVVDQFSPRAGTDTVRLLECEGSRSGLYRLASWFMSRGRCKSSAQQGAWTRCRTPLVHAAKSLRDLLIEEHKQ